MTGRPRKKFDLEQVELMGKFHATYETMAEWFECSVQTIGREMRRNEEFSNAYKKGFADTKMKLAEAQIKCALGGNPTMLVWLGKQYLGQREPKEEVTLQENDLRVIAEALRNHYDSE